MSTFVTGLKEIAKLIDDESRPKLNTEWLSSKVADGQSVTARFVNEMDEDSPNYDPERGLAIVAWEHSHPDDFKRKTLCTMETEGQCYGCEQVAAGKKGWWKKPRFYINILIDNGVDAPEVVTWSMGVKRSVTFDTIREYAIETKSISNLKWRLKRHGDGTDTTWTLIPTSPDAVPFDWSEVTLPDLEEAVRNVPYADQAAFFASPNSAGSIPKKEVADSSVPW